MKKKIIVVFLLFAIAIFMRVQFIHPHHPDHYTWGQYAYSLIETGYAPWVLHPASLFGYYPLSIPSGFEFFFAFLSNITGVDVAILFYFFSMFLGIFGAYLLFVLMRRWTTFDVSLIVAFIYLTMVFFSKATSFNASTRMFNVVFYPLFILTLFKIHDSWKKKGMWKYIATAIILFLFMSVIHRLAQLSIVFLIAFIASLIIYNWEKILEKFKKTKFYDKRRSSYDSSGIHIILDLFIVFLIFLGVMSIKSKFILIMFILLLLSFFYFLHFKTIRKIDFIFLDTVILFGLLIAAKVIDLLIRGRLLHHLAKVYPIIEPFIYLIIICVILIISGLYFFRRQILNLSKTIITVLETYIERFLLYFINKPDKTISIALFILLIGFIFILFTSGGIFGLDMSYYKDSFILKGNNPFVIVANFLFNLNNNLTILIWFAAIGILYLFFKSEKKFYDYFMIMSVLLFSQIMLDWEYARLYISPIYAILIGLGLHATIVNISKIRFKVVRIVAASFLVLLIALHFFAANVLIHRDTVLQDIGIEQEYKTVSEDQYIAAGLYLKGNWNVSLLYSKEQVRYQKIAFYAQMPGSVVAQSIFTDNKPYEIEMITIDEIIDDIKRGNKIRQVYRLKDWLFRDSYYHGRHIFNLLNQDIKERNVDRILEENHIRYIADSDVATHKYDFFWSIRPIKNKLFATPNLHIYDIENGLT